MLELKKNTWAEGLNPTYRPLAVKDVEAFIMCVLADKNHLEFSKPEVELPFASKVVELRVEKLKLPISFTIPALLAIPCFNHSQGGAVIILIDCLNAYPNEKVDVDKLSSLYPMGFYDERTMERYIDEYMKPRKVKWSDIY